MMHVSRRFKSVAAMAAALFLAAGAAGAAETDKPVTLELNKLEAAGKSCRLYFFIDNPSQELLQSLKLDLIVFGTDGVIADRSVIEFGPLPPLKKRVKSFEFENRTCDGIGSILLNDAVECRNAAGAVPDCLQHLKISSRAKATFGK